MEMLTISSDGRGELILAGFDLDGDVFSTPFELTQVFPYFEEISWLIVGYNGFCSVSDAISDDWLINIRRTISTYKVFICYIF